MNKINRTNTKKVLVGSIYVGGDSSISVQSMTNTDTRDVVSTIKQINALSAIGCDIIRVAVVDMNAAAAIKDIKKAISIPLVADIHFDYNLALECIKNGADKIRLNPGNIGSIDRVEKVVRAAKERKIPIRIGVNAGSLEKSLLHKYGHVTPEALVESAMYHVKILEDLDFGDIIISIKASNVPTNIEAYKLISSKVDYPLHLGVTEAGTPKTGIVKSSIGIGHLLCLGIGDTIRVSLTSDPLLEVETGKQILKSLDLLKDGPELISCPTCGRTNIDLISIAEEVEKRIVGVKKNIKVAVMGCAVNGPGEAKEADIGIAGGCGEAILFKKGVIIRKIPQERIIDELMEEIKNLEV
jgi:(E)-4-hydroxy-3-methylbut-2-enyl-diphosphate synthase